MKRLLTPAEQALWRRTVRGVASLRRTGAPALRESPAASAPAGASLRPPAAGAKSAARRSPSLERGRPDPFHAGDPRAERDVRRGRTPIDARLDLHGLRQGAAREALLRFLTKTRAEGGRCVLVVTGKGGRFSPALSGAGGVLRARLRDWLREDAFRRHIARASQAHPRHGGEGAFYVFLKAPSRGARQP